LHAIAQSGRKARSKNDRHSTKHTAIFRFRSASLGPNLEEGIPGARTEGAPVGSNAQTADAVVMPYELVHQHALLCVPHIAVVVVITCEEHAASEGESDRCNAAQDLVVRENGSVAGKRAHRRGGSSSRRFQCQTSFHPGRTERC